MYDYSNRHALVTGAAHGIGRAIANRLAGEGCTLTLWDLDEQALTRTASELTEGGANVSYRRVDVANLAEVADGHEAVARKFGTPDILVNNAGIGQVASVLEIRPEDFERTLRVNVTGAFNCCHVVVPQMVEKRRGSIINIASWFGKSGRPASLAYCASKFALIGMTQSMAIDLAVHGIRVNAVCPGTIANTQMRADADAQAVARGLPPASERKHQIPLGRLGEPDDVANVVAFLLSGEASYMTGQSINVTGGLWMN
ncbi:MAG TPA: SDR family NAD(P)-dependent oxidoreductase [Rhizobiaceae bacterium]|nr:SDR family NAD(P)-dependent oxidoreductase [Rhizobiaceae bacterium]